MSDYIYGSSLRAAKSKANYLFEGDFRRRPNQNLSGASRSVARNELLQQAIEQRQSREDTRRKDQASVKIQAAWRGYSCRNVLARKMRSSFDKLIIENPTIYNSESFPAKEFDKVICEFVLYYHSKYDQARFDRLINFITKNSDIIESSRGESSNRWIFRTIRLLKINLCLLQDNAGSDKSWLHLSFLEFFTRPGSILTDTQATVIWLILINRKLYKCLRQLADVHDFRQDNSNTNTKFKTSQVIMQLIRRSLDIDIDINLSQSIKKIAPSYALFKQFFGGTLNNMVNDTYLYELLREPPKQMLPRNIINAFAASQNSLSHCMIITNERKLLPDSVEFKKCKDAIYLCYYFVKALHQEVTSQQLTDADKIKYINILSKLIAPAELVTNISLMNASNTDEEQDEDCFEDIDSSSRVCQMNRQNSEIQVVISKIIELINDLPHVNGLKTILFNEDLQSQVQSAAIQICNLMLTHEYLAIFNCRLLYTVAFSRQFTRHLWKSIISASTPTLFGTSTPLYLQISRGNDLGYESWKLILPKLRLFCSLCSYLLPTLDDEEFYAPEDQSMITEGSLKIDAKRNLPTSREVNSNGTLFFDRELIQISAILRDLCIGMIEILYQNNRYTYQTHSPQRKVNGDLQNVLSFELKLCFKALVRLVCQLHAKDSRKQFCPDGHWICPLVVIPPNKAIDFQLVTSQQGRLLNLITKDDQSSGHLNNASNEVKTVLILQEIPFVISFQDRVQIFHELLRKDRQVHQSDDHHFGLPGTAIHIQIRRNYIYEDAFDKLSYEREPNLKLPLKISLINAVGANEVGIDGGGLTKEFLGELLKAGFDPMRGFFKYTKDHHLYPNPSANVIFSSLPEGLEVHYEFLGRILGKAIYEKMMVELPLASFFLAKLLALKHSLDVDLHNLESLDPVLHKNLVYLKNYKGDVADLNLDFTISNNELDEHEVVELKLNGSKIPVTRDNKIEYVHLIADYRLNKQIRAQCAAFKRGLAQLVDLDWLRMFDPRELQILISGAPTTIDIADWRRHTLYANGYSDECESIKVFWAVVSQFSEVDKRKLLKFATSCSLPPLLGFKDLNPQFAIAPAEEERLPTASTCMNLLKLPKCEDETNMRAKLLYAINSNSGFDLS